MKTSLRIRRSDTTSLAFQALEEEGASLELQRRPLTNQRALIDLERAELEQQMAALQLHSAFLDTYSQQEDQQEAMLASDTNLRSVLQH